MAGKKIQTDEEAYGVGYDNQGTSPPPPPPPPGGGGQSTLFKPLRPGELGPPSLGVAVEPPKGKARFEEFMRSAPPGFAPGTPQWDDWLIKQVAAGVGAGADPEFGQLLMREMQAAVNRVNKRAEEDAKRRKAAEEQAVKDAAKQRGRQGTRQAERAETGFEAQRAKRGINFGPLEVVVGPDGNPVAQRRQAQPPQSQSEAQAPPSDDGEELGDVRDGNYVWASRKAVTEGNVTRDVDSFRSVDDAKKGLAYLTPQDIAAIQEAFSLPVTGVPDKGTQAVWDEAVETAARLTAAGRNVSVDQVLMLMLNAEQAKRRASGGGGGGGGGGGYDPSQVRAFFTQVMKQEVGREPTEQEANAFYAAFSGGGATDPQQFAIDWIRNNMGKEAGAFSAVNYYDVVMQLLAGG